MTREHSAGIFLYSLQKQQALLIRVRAKDFELPKGHLEKAESPNAAAERELLEETALESPITVRESIGHLSYQFETPKGQVMKRVDYFLATTKDEPVRFGKRPKRTRELRWINQEELEAIPLVSQELRRILKKGFEQTSSLRDT